MIRFGKLFVFFSLGVQLLFEVDAKVPLTDERIGNGQWADTGIDQFFRVHTDTDGVLQFKAAGIRSNLPLFEGKTADLKELSLALKDKGNTFLKEYGVTDVELTPQSKNIVLDSDAFADGKKVQIDKSSSFFKIVFEGAGLMGTLLKTGKIEDTTYLESSEGKVTIHGPPIVTGATEAGVRAVTDITGTVVMVYDLAVDKEARKQAWEGLLGIKNQIAENPSTLWPLLGEAILEEATQTTPEDWQIMNNPSTDPGKQKHLYSRGTVRTATSVFLSGNFIVKLPKIADDIVLKMARAKGRLKIKNVAEATQELQDNLGALLEKIKALPEQGKKFLDDFADASDETIEAFLRNPNLINGWKGLSNREAWVRTNTELLERISGEGDEFITKVDDFYKNSLVKHSGCNPPCIKPTVYGDISFDKFGFPNLKNYVSDQNHIFSFDNLTGKASDFTIGKNKLQQYLDSNGGGIVTKQNPNQSAWSPFYIEKDGVKQGPYTWHHHQDAKTLMPVRTEVHNASKPHTGGATIANPENFDYTILKGLFKYE